MTNDKRPDYYTDVYGDSSITWVPPVVEYGYHQNLTKRGENNRTFRWEEVQIPLSGAISGAMLDYIMPDEYIIQISPDIGWHDKLSMLGDPGYTDGKNPHLKSIGPLSISNGQLTDNLDGSVQYDLSLDQWQSSLPKGYTKYVWRAVPFGDGNPGLGGIEQEFEYVSTYDQLKFSVDTFLKETKRPVQIISGKKSNRVVISIEYKSLTPFVKNTSSM